MRGGLSMAIATGLVVLASGATAAPSLETYHLEGAVGAYPVGMSITVEGGSTFDAGHYFYDRQLKDIPLTGRIDGRSVTLSAPGGETFRLTLRGNGGTGGDGASFETSVGLDGTWTKGARRLPVKLGMDFVTQGPPDARLYADVTDASDTAFEALVAKFLRAALAGDRRTAASAVSYPLRVNGAHALVVRTPAALIARWTEIFTPALLAQLKSAVPHEMFVHEGQAMIAGGAVWFDASGASAINEP